MVSWMWFSFIVSLSSSLISIWGMPLNVCFSEHESADSVWTWQYWVYQNLASTYNAYLGLFSFGFKKCFRCQLHFFVINKIRRSSCYVRKFTGLASPYVRRGLKASNCCFSAVVWVILYETENTVCTTSMCLRFRMVLLLCGVCVLTVVAYAWCDETFFTIKYCA